MNNKNPEYYDSHTLEKYAETLERLGFQVIIKDEVKYPIRFFDVGAVIFVAKACVWNFPGFSVETHFDKLCEIHYDIEKNGYYQTTGGRFLLAARKLFPRQ